MLTDRPTAEGSHQVPDVCIYGLYGRLIVLQTLQCRVLCLSADEIVDLDVPLTARPCLDCQI